MKLTAPSRVFALAAASLCLWYTGCNQRTGLQTFGRDERGHRLVRISFRSHPESFTARVNAGPIRKLSTGSFTNAMTRLELEYGDIVIWEADRDEHGKELSWPPGISAWWHGYLRSVRASFYCINSDAVSDFFAVPIYHWKAPPEKPRPLSGATFYTNGESLGAGSSGFRAMLNAIQTQRSGWVFILAPRIKNEGQESSLDTDDQELAWAKEAGALDKFESIEYGERGGLTDFARLADEP